MPDDTYSGLSFKDFTSQTVVVEGSSFKCRSISEISIYIYITKFMVQRWYHLGEGFVCHHHSQCSLTAAAKFLLAYNKNKRSTMKYA